jgi:hypothetical protein
MRRRVWWLVGLLCLLVLTSMAVGGWRAGVAVGLPAYLVVLAGARAAVADRPVPWPPVPADPRPASWTPADRLAGALSWGTASGRDFDLSTRPVLQRALRAVLAGRGLDLDHDRDQVRRLLGDQAWYLLDPARPPRDDRSTGGVDRATLERLVTRLEGLTR